MHICNLISCTYHRVVLSVKDIKMTSVFTMLRKCCNHPYLLEFPLTLDGDFLVDEQIVASCGKVLLLDRMLPALIGRGHKVLIVCSLNLMCRHYRCPKQLVATVEL